MLVTAQSWTSQLFRVVLIKQRKVSSGLSHDSVLSLGPFGIFICHIGGDIKDKLIKVSRIRS